MMQGNHLKYLRSDFKAMGTLCEIQLFAPTKAKAKHAANAAIADVQRLEALYSRYKTDSFLSEIDQVAATAAVSLLMKKPLVCWIMR